MRITFLVLVLVIVSGCSGGSLIGQSLEARARAYYNYMAGRTPKITLSSFYSPAYKATFSKESLKELDTAMKRASSPSNLHPEVTVKDVFINQEGKFAITQVNPELGPSMRALDPVRWVKAGNSWYLYLGMDAELGNYGEFPVSIPIPDVSKKAQDLAEDQDGTEASLDEAGQSEPADE